jgi:hypothetical protein
VGDSSYHAVDHSSPMMTLGGNRQTSPSEITDDFLVINSSGKLDPAVMSSRRPRRSMSRAEQ